MNFSKEWDKLYRENAHMSIWPWSELVSYVMRYARPNKADFRVLELGCGAGANIPFFRNLKVDYFAVEGSSSIVKLLHDKYPDIKNNIIAADFTKEIPFSGQFDLIVDRTSVTHNSTAAIINCLKLVHDKLIHGGKYIGIGWFSTKHSGYRDGSQAEDPNTRINIEKGPFVGVGRAHFSDKKHLLDLFSDFTIEIMEYKSAQRVIPKDDYLSASWNLVAKKE